MGILSISEPVEILTLIDLKGLYPRACVYVTVSIVTAGFDTVLRRPEMILAYQCMF